VLAAIGKNAIASPTAAVEVIAAVTHRGEKPICSPALCPEPRAIAR